MSKCLVYSRSKHNVINNDAPYCTEFLVAPSKINLIEYKNKSLFLGIKMAQ